MCDTLAVSCRLLRSSGSVESKYGPLYWRLAGTPSTPRVRNGESTTAALVPPAFCSRQFFCEYLRRRERARAEHPAPGRREDAVRRRRRGDRRRVDGGADRRLAQVGPVVDEVALQRVTRRDRAGQLRFVARVVVRRGIRNPRLRERGLRGRPLGAEAAEEPQPVAHDRAAGRRLVGRRQLARPRGPRRLLERGLDAPGRVGEVGAERAREHVAAAARDHVDDRRR